VGECQLVFAGVPSLDVDEGVEELGMVTQRSRDGAEPSNVQRLVLGEAMLLVAGGVMVGMPS